jgi:gamma-glutamyltranspeptidase/glutathione hydrolase
LIAYALGLLDAQPAPPTLEAVVGAMEAAQRERTPEFVQGLSEEGFLACFLSSRLGSTTHISVLDGRGVACSVTCTNGEGSGVVVPGTGIHLNNVMGEEDLSPLGFHTHPAGRRMPSMMAPSVVMLAGRSEISPCARAGGPPIPVSISDRWRPRHVPGWVGLPFRYRSPIGGEVELVLGSAGSNRIRSAILQTIVGVVDLGLSAPEAVRAPRVHFEDGILYHEPGLEPGHGLMGEREVVRFHDLNLFFGGVQAVQRRGGELIGAGDPRRGGVAVAA